MMMEHTDPTLAELLEEIGAAGSLLHAMGASEGTAGNISVSVGWEFDPRVFFPNESRMVLPQAVPELAGRSILVSGSGRRLREIGRDPTGNLGCVVVEPGGRTGRLHTGRRCLFQRVSSEFNSHLMLHRQRVVASGTDFVAVVHAHPPYVAYLTHLPRYQAPDQFDRRILRWQPELLVQFPEGLGHVPFMVPSSEELVQATLAALGEHTVMVWDKHGVVAISESSVQHAVDRIEYVESGAHYEYLNLLNHEEGEGLTCSEAAAICERFGVQNHLAALSL